MFDKADPFPLDIRLRYRHTGIEAKLGNSCGIADGYSLSFTTIQKSNGRMQENLCHHCNRPNFHYEVLSLFLCLLKLKAADPRLINI